MKIFTVRFVIVLLFAQLAACSSGFLGLVPRYTGKVNPDFVASQPSSTSVLRQQIQQQGNNQTNQLLQNVNDSAPKKIKMSASSHKKLQELLQFKNQEVQ